MSEYRSARAVEALHSQLRHTIVALREGAAAVVDVTELVPGDVVRIGVGGVVPADLRLLEAEGLERRRRLALPELPAAAADADPAQQRSIFDFGTFAILLLGFEASHTFFRSGWFIESLATQSLAIFAIRTHRVPFFRSRPSTALTASTLVVVVIAFALPFSPLAHTLGFTSLPPGLVGAIAAIVPAYLLVLELAKRLFYRREAARPSTAPVRRPPHEHRVLRRASRWTLRRSRRPRSPRSTQATAAPSAR